MTAVKPGSVPLSPVPLRVEPDQVSVDGRSLCAGGGSVRVSVLLAADLGLVGAGGGRGPVRLGLGLGVHQGEGKLGDEFTEIQGKSWFAYY